MPFIPTVDVARSALRMSYFGQDVINTLWFLNSDGAWGETTLGDLNVELVDWWGFNIAPQLSADIELVEVTSISQASITAPSVTQQAAVPGVLVGAGSPGSNCITISFRTVNRGRSGRGRNYVSGLRDADITGNTLLSVRAQSLAQGYDVLRTAPLLAGSAIWGVVSHYSEGVARASGLFQVINSVIVADENIDSQRRRLTGRGQ